MKRALLWCCLIGVICVVGCDSTGGGSFPLTASASSPQRVDSSSATALSSLAIEGCPAGKHIVGYFPSWRGDVAKVQYQYLTHINYSFVLPNADGSLVPMTSESANRLKTLVGMAHDADVKVGIALGGWNDGDDSAFAALAANATARARFVDEVIDLVEQYNLDGVDMDWEHPDSPAEKVGYLALMRDLRAALDALQNSYFLTAAVVGAGDWSGQYVAPEVFELVDFLNLMAYDNYDQAHHSSLEYAQEAISYWQKRGLTRDKTVIGVPFYSRPTYLSYRSLVEASEGNACTSQAGADYYNGIPTIRAKAAVTDSSACGVMMWELSQDTGDDTSLLKALWERTMKQPASYQCP